MNRLQKKCVIGSAGVHLLLALVLLVGPAFMGPKDTSENLPPLDFVPSRTVDALISGGGRPDASPLPPAPQRQTPPEPPAPLPPPPKPVKPAPKPDAEDPIKEVIKDFKKIKDVEEVKDVKDAKDSSDSKDEPNPLELPKKTKKRDVSTTLVKRKTDSGAEAKAKARAEAKAKAEAEEEAAAEQQAREYADYRHRVFSAVGHADNAIGSKVSGGTSFELRGIGGGGVPYANFKQSVISAYTRAWIVPDGVTDKDATVETLVVIGRDGTVLSARITQRSGNSELDRSVQRVLERVKQVPPLPEDSKDDQREVPINFNAFVKPSIG